MGVKGCKVHGYDRMDIVTSNRTYEILHFFELSDKFQAVARKDFDYLADDMEETSGYFIYKKQLHNLSDFMRGSNEVYKFGKNRKFRVDGASGNSYFSGTVVEIQRSQDCLKVARIYS